jgi:hypothetical protein
MRIWAFLLTFFAAAALRAAVPELLADAAGKYSQDAGHWAQTQTTIERDKDGKTSKVRVVRYDPSQPYDEQWTLLTLDGQPATAEQVKKYRKEAEERRKNRKTVGELAELDQAAVLEETDQTVTYEVPLRKMDNVRLPPEKFQLLMRVNKARRAFESASIRLRSPVRAVLLLKLKSGEADVGFATVDPKFAPPVTSIHADGTGSVMFVRVGGSYDQVRSDFKRVKPYDERFEVKLGPLKTLDL